MKNCIARRNTSHVTQKWSTFRHIHFHVFAKPSDLPDELKGGGSFALLKVKPEEAVPPNEIIAFCELLKDRFDQTYPIRISEP